MGIEQQLLKRLKDVTFLARGNAAVLIGLGEELGLPIELRQLSIDDGADDPEMEGVSIGAIVGQIQVTNETSFELVEGQWVFKPSGWDTSCYYLVGDWWPILAYLRLEALVREVVTTYAGLDLTDIVTLGRRLSWSEEATYCEGGKPGPAYNLMHWLEHGKKHNFWGYIDAQNPIVVLSQYEARYWMPAEKNWLHLIAALIARQNSLNITGPAA